MTTSENCCGDDLSDSLCFQTVPIKSDNNEHQSSCLPVRSALEKSQKNCPNDHMSCQSHEVCLQPLIQDNSTKLLKVKMVKQVLMHIS